jgi:membrane protease YdiL (CAAX protease family)
LLIFYRVIDIFSSRNNKIFTLRLIEPVILFSVFFLPGYFAQSMQDFAPDAFESVWFNLYYLITTIPQIALILYVMELKPGRSLHDFDLRPLRASDIPKALLTLAGIYLCIIPLGLIAVILVPELDNPVIYGAGWEFSNLKLIPLVLISCLAAGYSEELFFRAYLIKSLRRAGSGLVPAVIVSTLLFAAGHIYAGYFAFAAIAVIGTFLSFIFIKTRSIHVVAIGHGLYNFSVLIISMLEVT